MRSTTRKGLQITARRPVVLYEQPPAGDGHVRCITVRSGTPETELPSCAVSLPALARLRALALMHSRLVELAAGGDAGGEPAVAAERLQ